MEHEGPRKREQKPPQFCRHIEAKWKKKEEFEVEREGSKKKTKAPCCFMATNHKPTAKAFSTEQPGSSATTAPSYGRGEMG